MNPRSQPPGTAVECKSCGALIVWTVTTKGKAMPCDVSGSVHGKFFLFRRADKIEAIHINADHPSAEVARQRGQQPHQSHFATCPHADQHRTRRPSRSRRRR